MAHEDVQLEPGVDMNPENGQFLPGNRSKGGRPQGAYSISVQIKRRLQEVDPINRKKYLELLVDAIMHKAVADGDEKMIKLIWNYMDGMPQQKTDITSGGKPIPILGNVQANDSDEENSEAEKED